MRIPDHGLDEETLFTKLARHRSADVDWRAGRSFGYTYDGGRDAERVAKRAYMELLSENALDPTVYPSLLRFEVEVVGMARRHLHGDDNVVGSFTSGGTESVLLAVKTARDRARAERPGLRTPKMLLPDSAHAAFHKAAEYFDVEIVKVPLGADFRADAAAARELFTDDVVLVVGSAPQFAQGVVDPIEELAALAKERGALMHVDACIGGWLLGYLERIGERVPPFDFRVDGVTSISMDLHKYAFCAKGASVLLHRDANIRRHQIFSCAEWNGYSVVNSTVQSTKSGGPVAAAWAVLQFVGDDGYREHARKLRDTTRTIVDGIRAIDGLAIMGDPIMSLVAFTSDVVDVFHVVDEMKARGWLLGAQLAYAGAPPSVHLTIQPGNAAHVDAFLADLARAVAAAKALPQSETAAQVRAAFGAMTGADVTPEVFGQLLALAGMTGTGLPDRMAEIHQVMNALPRSVTEQLLAEYVNQLFTEKH